MIKIGYWEGLFLIHIRDYVYEKGKHIPLKKGTAFTETTWNKIMNNIDQIDELIKLKIKFK